MQVMTVDLEQAKGVAKEIARRNQCAELVFTIRNGAHQVLWHEVYHEGDPVLRFFKSEPNARVEP